MRQPEMTIWGDHLDDKQKIEWAHDKDPFDLLDVTLAKQL